MAVASRASPRCSADFAEVAVNETKGISPGVAVRKLSRVIHVEDISTGWSMSSTMPGTVTSARLVVTWLSGVSQSGDCLAAPTGPK